ncbi:adenosine deaminase-like [Centruroides sculpturatus]|uniref:adenosine deaminase-like n=1 Tax=Centruroides sculpturatus TaxID=218467 RepID=UPI000C6D4D04|nr:adenosine deaminase-like [Centruroides sculpturatus]
MRFSPQLCCSSPNQESNLSAEEVLNSVIKGMNKGQKDFNIKTKIILCCIRGHPEWSQEVLDLCEKYQNDGVVGIDIAGDEAQELASPTDIEIYKKAKELGIHRTVHAGEAGPASNVSIAIHEMYTERIGHGYHILEDEAIYENALSSGIHFEICPYSSYLTGSVSPEITHPVVRFAEDNLSFSINKDDTTLIGKTLDEEYDLLRKIGLKEVHFTRAVSLIIT